MSKHGQRPRNKELALALAAILASGCSILSLWETNPAELRAGGGAGARRPNGQPQLVSMDLLPAEIEGQMCEWVPASASTTFSEMFQTEQAPTRAVAPRPTAAQVAAVNARQPRRMIKDNYASYSSVAVDLTNDEVVMTDESMFS